MSVRSTARVINAELFFSRRGSRSFGRADNEALKLRATTAVVAMKTAEQNSGSEQL
jgi:hypothetical protein